MNILTQTLIYFFIVIITIRFSQAQTDSFSEINSNDSIVCLADVTIINSIEPYELKHQSILIKKSIIVEIGSTSNIVVPANAKIINLRGKYVIPGLIDGHVHLTGRPESSLYIALKKGVMAVRDMGGDGAYLKEVKDAIRNGELMAPDIYFSALIGGDNLIKNDLRVKLSTPPEYQLGDAPWMRLASDTSDIAQIIIDAKKCGATGIKMYSDITLATLNKLVIEANGAQIRTWAHAALIPATVEEVISSGVEVISHLPFLLYKEDWDLKKDGSLAFNKSSLKAERFTSILDMMKANNTKLDPTLSVFMWSIDKFSTGNQTKELKSTLFEAVKAIYDYNITIIAGTDVPLPTSDKESLSLHKEVEMYVNNCGLSAIEGLKTATINNARMLGIDNTNGSVEVGKKADLVVLNCNPLKKIENIEEVYIVIKNGIIVK